MKTQQTVLVVDDDRPTREMLRDALEAEGYLVWTLDSGRNVVEALRQASGPVVVLLDLMMPGPSGWDVCAALAADPRLAVHPVVVMSAGLLRGDPTPAYARAVLQKPFDLDALYATVARFQVARPRPQLATLAG